VKLKKRSSVSSEAPFQGGVKPMFDYILYGIYFFSQKKLHTYASANQSIYLNHSAGVLRKKSWTNAKLFYASVSCRYVCKCNSIRDWNAVYTKSCGWLLKYYVVGYTETKQRCSRHCQPIKMKLRKHFSHLKHLSYFPWLTPLQKPTLKIYPTAEFSRKWHQRHVTDLPILYEIS